MMTTIQVKQCRHTFFFLKKKKKLTIRVAPNIYHQALSRLISIHAQGNEKGVFKLKPNTEVDHEDTEPPAFHLVPQPDQGKINI